jgi:hypothetical protein
MKGLILFLLFTSFSVNAFLIDRSDTGRLNKWPSSKSINFFLTTSVPNLTNNEVSSITFDSVEEFKPHVSNNISVLVSNDGEQRGRSDIYTMNNSSLFNDPGIIAVTEIFIDPESGRIYEADIVINGTYQFSNSTLNNKYFGNIMTHEIGHALGLDHSQLVDATMFFENRKGQHSLHTDDISGVRSLYGQSSTGSISGTVAGSGNITGVFGAHVSAYSLNSGKAVSSSVSDSNGGFSITNLPLDDSYFIYIEPLNNLGSVSNYYNVAKKNFCDSNNYYKGGFFQRCFGNDRGKPYGVTLDSSNRNVGLGNVSIKCGLEVSREYIISKGSIFTPELVTTSASDMFVGSSHIGYFNAVRTFDAFNNVDANFDDSFDEYNLDLSNHDIQSQYPNKDLYLEVKIMTQPFYSPLRVTTILDHDGFSNPVYTPFSSSTLPVNSDGNYDLGVTLRLPIDSDNLKNIYNLKIVPHDIDEILSMSPDSSLSYEIFSLSRADHNENRHFYFITTTLVEKSGINYVPVSHKNFGSISDNSNCMEGSQTYAVEANTVYENNSLRVSKNKKDESSFPIACGTIRDINSGPPGNGPFASLTILGFCIIFAMKVRSSQLVE